MSEDILSVSEGIGAVLDIFEPHRAMPDDHHLELPSAGVLNLIVGLRTIRKMAIAMERELAIHRAAENGRTVASELEAASLVTLCDLVADPEGRVIRPNFGAKK